MRWALACVIACARPIAQPAPRTVDEPAPEPPAATWPIDTFSALANAVNDDLERHERAFAEGDDLDAIAPCARPEPTHRAAIRDAVLAWIEHTYPHETAGDLALQFGCVERDGVIVDASMDRVARDVAIGRWWTLRVDGAHVTKLDGVEGNPPSDAGDVVTVEQIHTLALADLDGDGRLDVIGEHDTQRGPDGYVITAKGKRALGRITDGARLSRMPGTDVVLVMASLDGFVHYACVTATQLADCPAAHAARSYDDRRVQIHTLSLLHALPDREALDADLDLLGVPYRARAALLASAPTTTPRDRAVRHVRAFADSSHLDDEAFSAEASTVAGKLRAALGDAACPDDPQASPARLVRWARAIEPNLEPACDDCAPADKVTVLGHCTGAHGAYYDLTWKRVARHEASGVIRRAVVYVEGDRATLAASASADGMPQNLALDAITFDVQLYRHGGAAMAIVAQANLALAAFADGKPVGTGEVDRFYDAGGEPTAVVIGNRHMWHATPDGLADLGAFVDALDTTPPTTGAAAVIGDYERKRLAHTMLDGFQASYLVGDDARRQLATALAIVGAPAALVDEVLAAE